MCVCVRAYAIFYKNNKIVNFLLNILDEALASMKRKESIMNDVENKTKIVQWDQDRIWEMKLKIKTIQFKRFKITLRIRIC